MGMDLNNLTDAESSDSGHWWAPATTMNGNIRRAAHLVKRGFLIDPHVHSKCSDGLSTPLRMFLHAQRKGLHGLIVTDHDTTRHWDECLVAADRHGLLTSLGLEVSTAQGHLLAYFGCNTSARKVARALKLDQGRIPYLDVEQVIRQVKELGGITCIPHPFGPLYALGTRYLEQVDAVEEYNSWIHQGNKRFRNAFGYARRYRVAALGSSDSHYPYTIGFGATFVPNNVSVDKPDWFLDCVRKQLTTAIARQKPAQRRINFIKSTVSIPLNVRYNARHFRSKWQGYWKDHCREAIQRQWGLAFAASPPDRRGTEPVLSLR